MTADGEVLLITGTRKGIGKYLAHYYADRRFQVVGCSRQEPDYELDNYRHYCLDVTDEQKVNSMFSEIRKTYGHVDVLVNNAGIASMNHFLLTPFKTMRQILETNVLGTALFCREAAKLMRKRRCGRIINIVTVATPLKLEGEAIYASSKAAVINLTQILAKEFGPLGITVNAVGATPIKTDLIRGVTPEKLERLLGLQAIRRFGEFADVSNVIDFFIRKESDFITGQVVFLGGV